MIGAPGEQILGIGAYSKTTSYVAGGQTYIFSIEEFSGNATILLAKPDGTLTLTGKTAWSDGWDTVTSYVAGGRPFLFLVKQSNGTAKVQPIDPATGSIGVGASGNGTFGRFGSSNNGIYYDWTSGWTSVVAYEVSGKPFLFLSKWRNGTTKVVPIKSDGTLGSTLRTYDWSAGDTGAAVYVAGGKPFLLRARRDAGTAIVHPINSNGTVGSLLRKYSWKKPSDTDLNVEWSTVVTYQAAGSHYVARIP